MADYFFRGIWTTPEAKGVTRTTAVEAERLKLVTEGCDPKFDGVKRVPKEIFREVSKTQHAIQTLDKTISNLEMELAAAKAAQESILSGSPTSETAENKDSTEKKKYFMVIGINTAFSSRKRRDSVRATWMPQATLGETLARHRKKPRVYVGCMKSGPVLAQRGVRYHEPEHWKFGEPGNKYFRHATGQLYAISKDLASYIFVNQHVLHKYANEDVSLGSWFIGLDVRHIDDRRLCCGTPPIVNGRHRQGTPVLLHLIGAVVGYAGRLIG
ncbi:UNVERIFIED_CONTAM: putative beta-1,3-galactosyltransferase 2 [Sesamum latifolium]|uniref:Hexosyltransferase n=1 Tax=Sesamum latifolium TaxID=2727402 RepID=A0AAW2WTY8_9LAMI